VKFTFSYTVTYLRYFEHNSDCEIRRSKLENVTSVTAYETAL
jgi:hypothetical protein